ELSPISVELTYGLERIAMYIQKVDDFKKIRWNENTEYGDLFLEREIEFSEYNFKSASVKSLLTSFNDHEKQVFNLIDAELVYPAYDLILKCSHLFNLLDARGVISVTERAAYIARIRKMAKECALHYLKKFDPREERAV
ncbi:MAG: glycine--tRNA ligase subunit alpha, partial [Candidatus Cloacimonetes bacterium]|nr:glycine--tRNA ligase subunit alpha [Candidatus Cloacimonadota bacterium]